MPGNDDNGGASCPPQSFNLSLDYALIPQREHGLEGFHAGGHAGRCDKSRRAVAGRCCTGRICHAILPCKTTFGGFNTHALARLRLPSARLLQSCRDKLLFDFHNHHVTTRYSECSPRHPRRCCKSVQKTRETWL